MTEQEMAAEIQHALNVLKMAYAKTALPEPMLVVSPESAPFYHRNFNNQIDMSNRFLSTIPTPLAQPNGIQIWAEQRVTVRSF